MFPTSHETFIYVALAAALQSSSSFLGFPWLSRYQIFNKDYVQHKYIIS